MPASQGRKCTGVDIENRRNNGHTSSVAPCSETLHNALSRVVDLELLHAKFFAVVIQRHYQTGHFVGDRQSPCRGRWSVHCDQGSPDLH